MPEAQENNSFSSSAKSRRTSILTGGFALFLVAVVGVTLLINHNSSQSKNTVAAVTITDRGFVPATLTVRAGTRIVWTNTGATLHQVASNPFPTDNGLPGLKSAILNNTQAYSFTAGRTGTYGYHDQLDPTMNGTIVVEKK